jgi:hypothetical protein
MSYGLTVHASMQLQLHLKEKYAHPRADIHEIHQCLTAVRTYLLYPISDRSNNECGNVWVEILYRKVMCTEPIFMKLMRARKL